MNRSETFDQSVMDKLEQYLQTWWKIPVVPFEWQFKFEGCYYVCIPHSNIGSIYQINEAFLESGDWATAHLTERSSL